MKSKKLSQHVTLFASDRRFNREVCGEHAHYFDPLAPETAAEQIARVLDGNRAALEGLRAARDHATAFSSPAERANTYLALMTGGRGNLNPNDRS